MIHIFYDIKLNNTAKTINITHTKKYVLAKLYCPYLATTSSFYYINYMIVEFEAKRSPPDDKAPAVETELINYDAATHHPVFFGPMHKRIGVDADLLKDFDVSQAHPASIGYAFMSKPPPSPLPPPPIPPDKDTCTYSTSN